MKKPFAQYLGSVGFTPSLSTMISDTLERRVRKAVEFASRRVLDGLVFDEHEVDDVARQIVEETFSELRK